MKLYVYCKSCNHKIHINHPAKIRSDLPSYFEIKCSNCNNSNSYFSSDVIAEAGLTTAAGALLGGLLGLALGGPGALAGAILGGIVGKSSQDQDEQDVERFNNS